MASVAIVDSRLWIRLGFDAGFQKNIAFQIDRSNMAHLGAQMLLYDRIVIPTKDFGIVPILIAWLGQEVLSDALEERAIGFIRVPSLLGYAGNGAGLFPFRIQTRDGQAPPWWIQSAFGPTEIAPNIQLQHACPALSPVERSRLAELVLKNTLDFRWQEGFFDRHIANETYRDIDDAPDLKHFIFSREPLPNRGVAMNRLTGIDPNQLRVADIAAPRDGIDLVLRIAEINLELAMALKSDSADIGTSSGAETVLRKKLARAGASPSTLDGFLSLLDLANIPDIRPAIVDGDLTLREVWRKRQTRHGELFRRWLRTTGTQDPEELRQAYVAALEKRTLVDSLPIRVVRFLATTAIGAVSPVAGVVAGAADSLAADALLKGYTPRLFLDDLRKLPDTKLR